MLVEVHAENSIFVYRALQWIAFAGRPLMLHELAEAVIFDPDQSFSIDDRFMDCNSLLEMIPAGLVSTTPGKFTRYRDEILISREQDTDEGNSDGEVLGFDKYNTCKIRLAHFSVKEYLVSDRIIKGPANLYSIDENLVHKTIVKCCFRYFMHIGDSRPQPHARLLYQFPLLHHASISWAYHLHNIEAQARDPQVDDLMLEFFDTGKTDAWRVWTSVAFRITGYATKLIYVRAYPHDRYWNQKNSRLPFAEEEQNIPHPITWLCFLGLTEALKRVLPTLPLTLVSIPQRGILASPLYAATLRGCPQTVSLLLDAGADINAGLGTKDLPLVKAVYHGSKFVKLFLDRGAVANVKSAGGNFPPDSPLIEACQYGDLEVVKLLLDGGADPNLVAEDSRYRDVPLMVAFARDRIDVMEMLLAYGADPDYVTKGGGDLTTPLCLAASYEGLDAFKLLLQAGASPNLSPTGEYTPFHNAISATESRAIKLINLLLEYGVEPSIASKRGSDMKTPLIYAIDEGRSANFVSFLVGLDIDINIHALHRGKNALMFAMNSLSSWHSKDRTNGLKTVRVLLEAGAYQCADPHWQRACSLARQLIDEPGYRRVYFGEDDSRDGREGNSSDDDSEEGNSSDDDSEEGNSSDDDSEEWLSEDDSEENPRENDSEENPSEEDSEENPREDDSEENPREDDSEENPSDDDSDIVVGIWAEQIRALCSLMDEYSTKRNTEAVEKMEEIVSDVAGLFMEG
jgi:ankyrin repeat protein